MHKKEIANIFLYISFFSFWNTHFPMSLKIYYVETSWIHIHKHTRWYKTQIHAYTNTYTMTNTQSHKRTHKMKHTFTHTHSKTIFRWLLFFWLCKRVFLCIVFMCLCHGVCVNVCMSICVSLCKWVYVSLCVIMCVNVC